MKIQKTFNSIKECLTKDKKARQILFCSVVLVIVLIIGIVLFALYDIAENKRIDAEAVTFAEILEAPFGKSVKASDFLANLNGELLSDPEIDTNELGPVEVSFEYKNIKGKKRTKTFTVTVIDVTAPKIYGRDVYAVPLDYDGDLTDLILSGDDLDDHPIRKVIGSYDLSKPGNYQVEYVVTDASGNETKHPFILQVVEPSLDANSDGKIERPTLAFADAVKQYKTSQTKIGIDVSSWQGDIDWAKVKSAGVEFAMIRVGYQSGYGGDYALDKKFITNIEGASSVGLPIGIYFYSCAQNLDDARRQAEWVKSQVAPYDIALGIAFDWENWTDFNKAGVSFHTLNLIAETFLDEVSAAGYDGLLYGSKNYLERFWRPEKYAVWLAQYNDHVTYKGNYQLWQLADTGRVAGILGDVDIDVLYLDSVH